ncbi:hypothetical protein CPB86DRAFT_789511 [Serendipita vermifera]|nr:hypothetical protein CPB86DRAFT_789511 [Serendipita vermifera]
MSQRGNRLRKSTKVEETSETSVKVSTDFPQGYGDFEIQSSDNTIFYFPRGVLAHVSPVFRDMFDVANEDTPNAQNRITVTEDAATIRQLLHHIDPLKKPLPMEKDTIIPLLEAGRNYQVLKIGERFQGEACADRLFGEFTQEPMLLLSIAERFNMEPVGNYAMMKAVTAHVNKIVQDKWPVTHQTYGQLIQEREERAQFLSKSLIQIIQKRIRSLEDKITGPRQSRSLHSSGGDAVCFECIDKLHNLIIDVVSNVSMRPNWSSLYHGDAFRRSRDACLRCGRDLWSGNPVVIQETRSSPDNVQPLLDDLRRRVYTLEEKRIPLNSLNV